jgi:hypothetical protein
LFALYVAIATKCSCLIVRKGIRKTEKSFIWVQLKYRFVLFCFFSIDFATNRLPVISITIILQEVIRLFTDFSYESILL